MRQCVGSQVTAVQSRARHRISRRIYLMNFCYDNKSVGPLLRRRLLSSLSYLIKYMVGKNDFKLN